MSLLKFVALLFLFTGGVVVSPGVAEPVSAGESTLTVNDSAGDSSSDYTVDVLRERPTQSHKTSSPPSQAGYLVQFERPPNLVQPTENRAQVIRQLKDHVQTQKRSLIRYAIQTPGVVVERTFWLGSLASVRIMPSQLHGSFVARVQHQIQEIDSVRTIAPAELVEISNYTQSVGDVGRQAELKPPRQQPLPIDSPASDTFNTTYGISQINASEVWEAHDTKGEGSVVAVLDTGVDTAHPDINLSKWQEWERYGDPIDTEPQAYDFHGTHVSGTATGGNAGGVYIGVAPEAALYHGAVGTICDPYGCQASQQQLLAGMQWATEQGADVISMSWGGSARSLAYIQPARDAIAAGSLPVAGSGNKGKNSFASPGDTYEVLAVGASGEDLDVSSFSSGGVAYKENWPGTWEEKYNWTLWPEKWTIPTVVAPGRFVNSSIPVGTGNNYNTASGTSMATPHVSGAVALLQSATSQELSPATIRTVLRESAFKPSDAPTKAPYIRYGDGIIDVSRAVAAATGQSGTISGTVETNASERLENVTVTLTPTGGNHETGPTTPITTTTDRFGEFVVAVQPGTYELSITADSYQPNTTSVSVGAGDWVDREVTLLKKPSVIAGTVTTAGENMPVEPVANVTVAVETDSGVVTTTTTGANGSYSLELQPGVYDVTASRSGYDSTSATVSVEAAATTVQNFSLTVVGTGELNMTVTPASGAVPPDEVDVVLISGEEIKQELSVPQAVAYSTELTAGVYTVVAKVGNYTAAATDVAVDLNTSTELSLELSVGPPTLPGLSHPPQDLTGDGLYRDVDGDGHTNIFDVQVLFSTYRTEVAQFNSEFFNFAGTDPTEIRISDITALLADVN